MFKVSKTTSASRKVLIIYDSLFQVSITESFLRRCREVKLIKVHKAEAIARCKSDNYDLIMLDVNFNGSFVSETVSEIRRIARYANSFPVVLLCGSSSGLYSDLGVNEVIEKPFEVQHFQGRVQHYLGGAA
jgi:CheY-like chemotaxis protein